MKRPATPFQLPWPVPRHGAEGAEAAPMYAAFRTTRQGVREFTASPPWEKLRARLTASREDWFEMSRLVYEQERDRTHARILLHMVRLARAEKWDRIAALANTDIAIEAVAHATRDLDAPAWFAIVEGLVTDRDGERQAVDVAKTAMSAAPDGEAAAFALPQGPSLERVCEELTGMLAGREWLALADMVQDDLFSLAMGDQAETALDEEAAACEARLRVWRRERGLCGARLDRAGQRAESIARRLLTPLAKAVRRPLTHDPSLDGILIGIQLARYHHQLTLLTRPEGQRGCADDRLHQELARSWVFWFLVLQRMLCEHDGIAGSSFADWSLHLLVQMVHHPARLMRAAVPHGAEKARTALAKRVAPFVRGSPLGLDARRINVERLAALPAPAALMAVAQYCADTRQAHGQGAHASDAIAGELWDRYLSPHLDLVLLALAPQEDAAAQVTPVDVLDLLATWETEDRADRSGSDHPAEPAVPTAAPGYVPYVRTAVAPAPQAEVERVARWFYVREPGRADLAADEVAAVTGDRSRDLDDFLRQRGVDAVVKAVSIGAALDHFNRMPDVARALLPRETVGGNTWYKLKRGRMRILCRLTEAHDVLFHIYHRREWDHRIHL